MVVYLFLLVIKSLPPLDKVSQINHYYCMDPNKNLPGLDPKLKEAYERVMATSLPANQTPAATPPSPVQPQPEPVTPQSSTPPVTAPVTPSTPHIPQPTPEEPAPHAIAPHPMPMTTAGPKQASSGSTFVANTGTATPGKSKISPVILITAGAIFFVVYTLFWLRFFNVALPFLP
jgi:hypothetical protein